MDVNVNSTGQSGGITAQNINIENLQTPLPQQSPPDKPDWWKRAPVIISGIGLLVAVLTFFGYAVAQKQQSPSFHTKDEVPKIGAAKVENPHEVLPMSQPQNVNVTSINQSGGITAQNVNLGVPPRQIDAGLASQIVSIMGGNKKANVAAALGDAEAYQFAAKVKDFLSNKGFEVDGVDQAVWMPPVMGQAAHVKDGTVYFQVGTRQ
ncbi:MAG TPA: hypothetical protein VG838_11485 [Opitutaceae bacterium]|nr:hypothetical protein [Opitutaceae bacterium]